MGGTMTLNGELGRIPEDKAEKHTGTGIARVKALALGTPG